MPLTLNPTTHDLRHLLDGPADAEVREHYRRLGLLDAAGREVSRLSSQRAVEHAATLDTEALATALTAGEDDPGSQHEDARLAALRAAQRRVDGLTVAVRRSYDAVLAAITEASPEWLADLRAERDAQSAKVSAAVTALAAALDEIDLANATERFVTAVAEGEDLTARNVRGPERGRLLLDRGTLLVDGPLASVSADVVLAALAGYTGSAR